MPALADIGKWTMHIGLICFGYLVILDPNVKEAFPHNLEAVSKLAPALNPIAALVPYAYYVEVVLGVLIVLSVFSLASNSKLFAICGILGLVLYSAINNNPLVVPAHFDAQFELWLRLLKIFAAIGGLIYRIGEAGQCQAEETAAKEKKD